MLEITLERFPPECGEDRYNLKQKIPQKEGRYQGSYLPKEEIRKSISEATLVQDTKHKNIAMLKKHTKGHMEGLPVF